MSQPSFDQILTNLSESERQNVSDTDKLIALKKLEIEAEDRRAERSERERARAEEKSSKNDMMKTFATLLAPVFVNLMNKPAIDPAIASILAGRNNSDDFKSMMEMQRQQAAIQMETLTKSMLSIMEVKDSMNERLIEKAIEGAESNDSDTGILGIFNQVAKIAAPLLSAPAQSVAPEPLAISHTAHAANANPPAPAPRPVQEPVAVILHTMRRMQLGQLNAKQARTALPSMVVVALQDEKLVEAIMHDDQNVLISYCTPTVMQSTELSQWVQANGVADWLSEFVENELKPRIAYEIDEPDSDDENEPPELNAGNVAPVAPMAPAATAAMSAPTVTTNKKEA